MKEKIKRKLAMFLAVCLVITSFQGVAWASVDPDEGEVKDILLELDGQEILEKAEKAIRSGELYNEQWSFMQPQYTDDGEKLQQVNAEAYDAIFDHSTGNVYKLDDVAIKTGEEASPAEASKSDALAKMPEGTELFMFVKLNGQAAESASGSNAVLDRLGDSAASSSETDIITENYTLRGDEKIIFLFINNTNDELNFQLDISGRKSGIITVESGSSLLAEDEVETDIPFAAAAEELEEDAAGSPNAGENGGSDVPEESVGAEDASDETQASDDENDTTQVPGENDSQGDISDTDKNVSDTENQDGSEDKTQQGDIPNENPAEEGTQTNTDTGSDGTVTKPDESSKEDKNQDDSDSSQNVNNDAVTDSDNGSEAESDNTSSAGSEKQKENAGETDKNTADSSSVSSEKESTSTGDPGSDSGKENDSSSSDGDAVTASISSHVVPRLMSSLGPNAEFTGERGETTEEDYEEMFGDDEEEEEEETEDYDDSVMVYDESFDGVDIPTITYDTVLAKKKTSGLKRMVRALKAAVSTQSASNPAGALAVMSTGDIAGAPVLKNSDFKMDLYDYSGESWNNGAINGYLEETDIKFGTSNNATPHTGWNEEGKKGGAYRINIYQGIVKKNINLEEDGSLVLTGPFLKTNLFPQKDVKGKGGQDIIKKYDVNNPTDLFTIDKDKGYYTYDSKISPVQYDDATKELNIVDVNKEQYNNVGAAKISREYLHKDVEQKLYGGFWPFGSSNYFHGMHFSFNFSLMKSGKVNNENMIFEFQGDDDVWVYLTDLSGKTARLVLDIGGIHNSMGGKIDFATGDVTYSKAPAYLDSHNQTGAKTPGDVVHTGEYGSEKNPYGAIGAGKDEVKAYLYTEADWIKEPENLQKKFKDEYPLGAVGLSKNDLTQYRLDFFYLERGGKASNCYLHFNTPIENTKRVNVAKRVISNNSEKLNGQYKFDLYVKSEGKYPSQPNETINVKLKDGIGNASSEKEYVPGSSFYLVENEKDAAGATRTTWSNADSDSSPYTSGYGTIGKTGLLICTNYYSDMEPQVHKRAVQYEAGYYNLSLQVDGSSITNADEEGSATEKYSLKNVTAFDTLSTNAEFVLKDSKPQVILTKEDGTKEALQLTGSGTATDPWKDEANTVSITVEDKKIVWNVTSGSETLGDNQSKTLEVKIRAVGEYKADNSYDNKSDADTGTHSNDTGYYSNENSEAKVEYETELDAAGSPKKTVSFPKPVIRPVPNIVIEKKVQADPGAIVPQNEEYVFEIKTAQGENVDYTLLPIGNTNAVQVADNPSQFKIIGEGQVQLLLNDYTQNTTYKVEEIDMSKASDVRWEIGGQKGTLGTKIVTPVNQGEKVVFTNYYYAEETPPSNNNGGGSHGHGGGGGGGSSVTRITDSEVPLGQWTGDGDSNILITDPDVPLASLPKLGDTGIIGYVFGIMLALLIACGALYMRKRYSRS